MDHTKVVSEGEKNLRVAIQMIVLGIKRSCIIRSIHRNGRVVSLVLPHPPPRLRQH